MTAPAGTPPELSVIIATYERPMSVERLLHSLAEQTLQPCRFEVIVIDDGSRVAVAPRLGSLTLPYALTLITQANGGPAVARDAGIRRARAELIVMLDDDMRVGSDFLERHLAAHPIGSRRVVLGRLRAPAGQRLRLFERLQLALLDRLFDDVERGRATPRGKDLYTGNVSLRRSDYLAVGGFDPSLRLSEDAELGVRLEGAGVTFALSDSASALHASDHASLGKWMRRSVAYGASDTSIARKHGMARSTDPWRYLFLVNPLSRPFLLASAIAPALLRPIAWCAMGLAMALGTIRLERAALAGATFVYGILYFAGMRQAAGSRRRALRDLGHYLNGCAGPELGFVGRVGKLFADISEDHAAIGRADAKYGRANSPSPLLSDLIRRIGFQMMVAYRVMRFWRDVGLPFVAMVCARLIRHLYGADIHWDAELAPGAGIVHGTGLVISHAARVGPGCILFQHVTLGESIDAETRRIGAPVLERDVHVGPGATLLGPITLGAGTKVTGCVLLMQSVPPGSLVEAPAPTIRARGAVRPSAAIGSSTEHQIS